MEQDKKVNCLSLLSETNLENENPGITVLRDLGSIGKFASDRLELIVLTVFVCVCVTVDGGWAEWTAWSVCSSECERQRTRECTDPEPKHGGRLCDGAALDTDNCTGDLCIQGG